MTKVEPNYSQPWQMCPQRSGTGSAFVIDCDKRLVLTNSHVVSNATAVYLRRPGVAKKYKAEVLADAKVRRSSSGCFSNSRGCEAWPVLKMCMKIQVNCLISFPLLPSFSVL